MCASHTSLSGWWWNFVLRHRGGRCWTDLLSLRCWNGCCRVKIRDIRWWSERSIAVDLRIARYNSRVDCEVNFCQSDCAESNALDRETRVHPHLQERVHCRHVPDAFQGTTRRQSRHQVQPTRSGHHASRSIRLHFVRQSRLRIISRWPAPSFREVRKYLRTTTRTSPGRAPRGGPC